MRWIYPVLFLAAVFLLGADKCQDNHILAFPHFLYQPDFHLPWLNQIGSIW